MSLNEKQLLRRAIDGDHLAFEQLIEPQMQRMYNVALSLLRDREEAEDMTQEALIKIYRALPGYRGDAAFSTWAYRIVINTCRDRLRRIGKEELLSTAEEGEEMLQVADYSQMPEQLHEERETTAYLHGLIEALSPSYRTVFILREMAQLDYLEIAHTLTLSVGTVKSRLSRARQAMREQLLRDAEQDEALQRLIGQRGEKI